MDIRKKYKVNISVMILLCISLFVMSSIVVLAENGVQSRETDYVRIVLRQQGGTGGTSEIYVQSGGTMPAITPPTRRGYDFKGYYTATNGAGDKYYDETGDPVKNCDFIEEFALYALWKIQTYNITYNNMDGSEYGALHPIEHTYGKSTQISDPTKESYTFFGWKINDSLVANKGLTLGAMSYTGDITLTAVWNRAHLTTFVKNTTDSVSVKTDDLLEIYNRQVSDPTCGVTADDLNSEEVNLTMSASDKDELAEGAADIIGLAQGEALKFYDFSVIKSVIATADAVKVESHLSVLPNTVEVTINLNETLKDRSGYRIYRYHNGQAEAIPVGPVDNDDNQTREYYTITSEAGKQYITIHTRRLSTYAIVGNSRSIAEDGMVSEEDDIDVQARMRMDGVRPVYKLDCVWGDMEFQYSTAQEWDPDEHRYTNFRSFDWVSSGFAGGNNRITVVNHSNADVEVDFVVTRQKIDGVDMTLHTENRTDAPFAENIFLGKVPFERDSAPSINAYLWLQGSPTDESFYENGTVNARGYVQVAGIAVTVSYLDNGQLTPKSN